MKVQSIYNELMFREYNIKIHDPMKIQLIMFVYHWNLSEVEDGDPNN